MADKKFCPFMPPEEGHFIAECQGERCAVYLKMRKARMLVIQGHIAFPDPDYFMQYHGCGLVHEIPWSLMKREPDKPESAEEREAEEVYAKLETPKP